MEFQTEETDGAIVISTSQLDLDASNADEFKRQAAPLVEGRAKVLLDLAGIGFMDSAGLGAILSVYKAVRASGGQFSVFGPNKEVKALLDLVRMQRLFNVHPDKESAVNASSG